MERRVTFQAAMLAAIVAFVCAVLIGFVFRAPDPAVSLQPSQPVPLSDFVRPVNEYPTEMLRFFATDSLFVLSYLIVFVGLYTATSDRAPALARIGLGAGILAAALDATENAYFITYALASLKGVPLTDPDLSAVFIFANLKWMAAFATLLAFGLAWPRSDWLGQATAGLMLLFPLVGVIGVAAPGLVAVRGLFFFVGMPLFAWHFWRMAK